MRVKNLLIVSVKPGSDDKGEVDEGVAALATKYSSPKYAYTLNVTHAALDFDLKPLAVKTLKTASGETVGARHDFGAYFVFHYSLATPSAATSAPPVNSTADVVGQTLAKGFFGALEAAKFPAVTKVVLAACVAKDRSTKASPSAKPVVQENSSLAYHFAQTLKDLCGSKIPPPLIAGWTSWVSVAYTGHPEAVGMSTPPAVGSKIVQNNNHKVFLSKDKHEMKRVLVLQGEKYVTKLLTEVDWADNVTAHQGSGGLTNLVNGKETSDL